MSNSPYTGPWTALKVRDTFIEYFKDRGHKFGNHTNRLY